MHVDVRACVCERAHVMHSHHIELTSILIHAHTSDFHSNDSRTLRFFDHSHLSKKRFRFVVYLHREELVPV